MPKTTINYNHFLQNQLTQWPLAAKNFKDLNDIEVKEVTINGNLFRLQLNPHRMVSSAAKTDAKSIEARPCFLCKNNRPEEQNTIDLGNDFSFLVNPFPIFAEHFTIPTEAHIPQNLASHTEVGLNLALQLPDLLLFYNGARCGASAPDHFHFQAGSRGFLPLEVTIDQGACIGETLLSTTKGSAVEAINDHIRNYLIISGNNITELSYILTQTIAFLKGSELEEPRFNLLFWNHQGKLKLVFIPRAAHRPWQYSADGVENILFSPAAVEMGGVCIFARREDFEKMDSTLLQNMLQQVVYPNAPFANLCQHIKNMFLQ